MKTKEQERAVFDLLWSMVNKIQDTADPLTIGTIIGRYASMIDDRIKNSGYSRSVDSLKLYTYEQLQDELDERDSNVEN